MEDDDHFDVDMLNLVSGNYYSKNNTGNNQTSQNIKQKTSNEILRAKTIFRKGGRHRLKLKKKLPGLKLYKRKERKLFKFLLIYSLINILFIFISEKRKRRGRICGKNLYMSSH